MCTCLLLSRFNKTPTQVDSRIHRCNNINKYNNITILINTTMNIEVGGVCLFTRHLLMINYWLRIIVSTLKFIWSTWLMQTTTMITWRRELRDLPLYVGRIWVMWEGNAISRIQKSISFVYSADYQNNDVLTRLHGKRWAWNSKPSAPTTTKKQTQITFMTTTYRE